MPSQSPIIQSKTIPVLLIRNIGGPRDVPTHVPEANVPKTLPGIFASQPHRKNVVKL
jgi:hypothetical protein